MAEELLEDYLFNARRDPEAFGQGLKWGEEADEARSGRVRVELTGNGRDMEGAGVFLAGLQLAIRIETSQSSENRVEVMDV